MSRKTTTFQPILQCDYAKQQEGQRWEMRTTVGWGVREGFLEELAWSTMVDNPGGKNSKGQGLLVGELGRFEGQKRDQCG